MKLTLTTPFTLKFDKIGSPELGYISVAEYEKQIPFRIARVYWTYFTPEEVSRGHHAHHSLEQVLIAVSGKIRITLEDPENNTHEFELSKPDQGLYIPKLFWRTLHFEHNTVLLCLASEPYRQEDYIRDHDAFKKLR